MSASRKVTLPVGSGGGAPRAGPPPGRTELPVDEPDRHDPESLGGVEQPLPRAIAGGVVLPCDAVEPRERVADVRLVVDREAPDTVRVDVGERSIRELGPFAGAELGHPPTKPGAPTPAPAPAPPS